MAGTCSTPDDIDAMLHRKFAIHHTDLLLPDCKVLHVCALVGKGDVLVNMRIGPEAPKCTDDFFMLCLARACSRSIIQSGANLRCENTSLEIPAAFPALLRLQESVHSSSGRGTGAAAGPAQRPELAIVTRGSVDPSWTVFSPEHCARYCPVLYVPSPPSLSLPAALHPVSVRPLGAQPGGEGGRVLPAVIKDMQDRGAGRISIECGPTLTRPLYTLPLPSDPTCTGDVHAWVEGGQAVAGQDCPVDMLLLSTYKGPLQQGVLGEPLVRWDVLHSLFVPYGVPFSCPSTDGGSEGLGTIRLLRKKDRE